MVVSHLLRCSRALCLTAGALVAGLSPLFAQTPPRAPDERPVKRPASETPITIDLKPTAILEGHDLRATVKVLPRAVNRLLAVRIEAPTFYASTERELMGDSSQRTFTFKWEKLPAGWYRVEAVVTDAAGEVTRIHRDFQVYGGSLDSQMIEGPTTSGRRGRRGRR